MTKQKCGDCQGCDCGGGSDLIDVETIEEDGADIENIAEFLGWKKDPNLRPVFWSREEFPKTKILFVADRLGNVSFVVSLAFSEKMECCRCFFENPTETKLQVFKRSTHDGVEEIRGVSIRRIHDDGVVTALVFTDDTFDYVFISGSSSE